MCICTNGIVLKSLSSGRVPEGFNTGRVTGSLTWLFSVSLHGRSRKGSEGLPEACLKLLVRLGSEGSRRFSEDMPEGFRRTDIASGTK